MHSQFDFDKLVDTESLNSDRKVLNKSEDSGVPGLVFNTDRRPIMKNQTSVSDAGKSSVEFTGESSSFMEPLEDLDLISGRTRPTVVGTGMEVPVDFSKDHKIYDPSLDRTTGFGQVELGDVNRKTGEKFTKESFGLPDFYTNPVDLIIASVILVAVITIEIIGIIAIL